MPIISQETWDNIPEEEKQAIKDKAQFYIENASNNDDYCALLGGYVDLFGDENIGTKPNIRTWEDVEKEHPEYFKSHNTPNPKFIPSQELRDKLLNKTMAMYKIVALIELGYGGMVTDEEWRNEDINKFSIVCEENRLSIDCLPEERHFISFHYVQQAEEFMSYPENVELIKRYYMI